MFYNARNKNGVVLKLNGKNVNKIKFLCIFVYVCLVCVGVLEWFANLIDVLRSDFELQKYSKD